MQRYLNDEPSADGADAEEEEEGLEYLAFGMLTLAMAVGIVSRPTLAKWLP